MDKETLALAELDGKKEEGGLFESTVDEITRFDELD